MEWKNIYRGVMMGISDLVPGVSGCTIAVLLGIYDQLIAAINGLFSKDWKKHLSFLIPLVLGVGSAILAFSHLISWLLKNHESLTHYFFLGLIIGIIPFLLRESKAFTTFRWRHAGLLLLGVILISLIPIDQTEGALMTNLSLSSYLLLFFAGIAASAAMILPGISGSFVFLVLGTYNTITTAVTTLNLKIMIPVAIGIGIGILSMSKLIHFFLTHFRTATFAFIIGLVIGSVFLIFPGMATTLPGWMGSIILCLLGFGVAYLLGKIEYE